MADDLFSGGFEVFGGSWKGDNFPPRCKGGSVRILEWNGLYFIDAEKLGVFGPYRTVRDAASRAGIETETPGSISYSVSSSDLTEEQLKPFAMGILGDQEVIVLNGVSFIRRDDTLAKATKEEIEAANVAPDLDEDGDSEGDESEE